ncbi:hypothetical protein [Erwinia piriflorinigrans]|uniref:Type III secretion system protein n=1 Tax=Erwinia piriflorinigrans CFBP 5888 TaxID=1161919 RepID=V5Z4M9_9GAMM|nr:hypothetical protein [Erwinia piriflorinigrans]CCG86238.1 type III secretion system protein [Erwinia piriflorinigrans CFBP 5888]
MTTSLAPFASAQICHPAMRSNDKHSSAEVKGEGTVQGIATLADSLMSKQGIRHGQSVITGQHTGPILSTPHGGAAKISVEKTVEIQKMADNVRGPDARAIEYVANLLAISSPSFCSHAQIHNTSTESSKISSQSAVQNSSSAIPVRSHAAVDGGTDITAVGASGTGFRNVIGDMRIVELNNKITVEFGRSEAQSNISAAKFNRLAVNSAMSGGNKTIEAARQNSSGAITSAVMGISAQGVSTVKMTKALAKDSASINRNLKPAAKLEKNVYNHRNAIARSGDSMMSEGKRLDSRVKAALSESQDAHLLKVSNLRNDHTIIQNKTQKIRAVTELANQGIRAGQGVVEGIFNVAAAQETKQADLARADQNAKNDLSSIHQQTGKKSAETNTALSHAFETWLNNNGNAASSISERMR